jgi:hypothetical protein
MMILDFISAMLLIVYVIAENRYLTTVNFELLFAVLSMAMAVLSYLYNSLPSLAISSIVFLLVIIKILRVTKLVTPKKGGSKNGGKSEQNTRAPAS